MVVREVVKLKKKALVGLKQQTDTGEPKCCGFSSWLLEEVVGETIHSLLKIHNKENQNKQINTYLFRCAVYGSRCMMVSTGSSTAVTQHQHIYSL